MSDSADPAPSAPPSIDQVRRAENIQIVVATGVVSGYIALVSRNLLPEGILQSSLEAFVVSSVAFLALKLTTITIHTYSLPEIDKETYPRLSVIDDLSPDWMPNLESLRPDWAPSLESVDRTLIPFLYILSFWGALVSLIPALIPNQLIQSVLVVVSSQLGSATGSATGRFAPYIYLVGAILVLIRPGIRFALGYNTVMAQIDTASTEGSILLTSGRSGSEAEIRLRNPSDTEVIDASDIRLTIDSPSWIEVSIEDTLPLSEDGNVRRPTYDLPPDQSMNLAVQFNATSSRTRSVDQVQITTTFQDQIEQTETYNIET